MSADLPTPDSWLRTIFGITNNELRDEVMMQAYRLQFQHNPVYHTFCNLTGRTPQRVRSAGDIPYLPIQFFKTEQVVTGEGAPAGYFESSGTTGTMSSRHYFNDLEIYDAVCKRIFHSFYGEVSDYCILALLPSYLERKNSSLVYMVEKLIRDSCHPGSGFFLHDQDLLAEKLSGLEKEGQKTLLIGVTYALLDFAAKFPMPLQHTLVMETGGMKGRRQEMVRSEVHEQLRSAFQLRDIHSEYGMTELFSQAYAKKDGIFQSPPWMKVSTREEDDPFGGDRKSGVLYIADLANIFSCCFIATEDQGRMHEEGFEVLGRIDNSDIRGCSLMAN